MVGAGRPRVEMMTPHRAASGTDFVLCNRGLMDVAELSTAGIRDPSHLIG